MYTHTHIYNRRLFRYKKAGNPAIYNTMLKQGGHYAK